MELVLHISRTMAYLKKRPFSYKMRKANLKGDMPQGHLLAPFDVVQSDHQTLLGQIPVDIVLQVFIYLDVAGVLSLAQLRHSVLVTTAAEVSWKKDKPACVAKAHVVRLDNVVLDHASYVMKFTSRNHLVLPTKDGELIGWDTRTSSRAGNYTMGADSVLINVQGEYSTRSLYWITGRMSIDPENENNLHLKVLRIQFPEPSSSHPITFEDLGDLMTPWSLAAELHFLDASQNMICAVFECSETGTTGLHVILDWKKGLSYICDTGIPYEYGRAVVGLHLSDDKKSIILHTEHLGTEIRRAYSLAFLRSRASVWNRSRSGLVLPVLQPAAETSFLWEHDRAAFSDRTMTPHTVWVLPQWWPTYPGVPRRTSTIILFVAIVDSGSGSGPRRVWRAAQHYSNAVERGADGGAENNDDWKGKGRAEELGGAPCSPIRSVIDIMSPVLISLGNGLPILAQSFNHLGWIEERDEDEEVHTHARFGQFALKRLHSKSWILKRRRSRWRRSLKLVTFPDPGVSPRAHDCTVGEAGACYCECTTLKPVTLDVPESVLEQTYHMFLDPAAGTITLATEDNELHVYQYGRPTLC
ncbi:hypothetical protein EW145_g2700 [Phellinidium pouzarii]|uniref:F-box domain-containing protein n=1 Tax=Phellinidium pouzarii TaxID=167371 RepID=A0A4V3XD58_9AGAM|nr:hypothetical protein EW145_g2700 [Phellinidium pouzarii]